MTSQTTATSACARLRASAPAVLIACVIALCAACVSPAPEAEPAMDEVMPVQPEPPPVPEADAAVPEASIAPPPSLQQEGEVPFAVIEEAPPPVLDEVVVQGRLPERHESIRELVGEAQALLRGVELEYFFTGKGRKETLRGRPVVFALWSEAQSEWILAHVEIPRPPVTWKPGGRALKFQLRTPGIKARHVKGTGAERLMFSFTRGDEQLHVYGRKFPVFDNALLKKKQWRAVVETAQPIVYLPYTADTHDPALVSQGEEFLMSTARRAIEELREAGVPSAAYPGQLLADVVPPQVITTLAVIEQTDDADYNRKKTAAFEEVLNQYGLKREDAYRYSVSTASAIGPMQFTNSRGNGTYAMVVRRCPGAQIDPDFERGATNLLNAMKAAICLLDIELSQMRADIRDAYRPNPAVLGIFPVAAYNGGPRNVTRLYNVVRKAGVRLEDLRRPGEQPAKPVRCPCFWKQSGEQVRPVTIPRYNNENRWYVEKYQSILGLFE